VLKFNDQTHELNYPTVRQIKNLEKEEGELDLSHVTALVKECGLPEDVIDSLQANHLRELVSALVGKEKAT
jgi:hypothetical protein